MAVLDAINKKVLLAVEEKKSARRDKWITAGAYLSISYVLSLRGNKGFMMDIKETIEKQAIEERTGMDRFELNLER